MEKKSNIRLKKSPSTTLESPLINVKSSCVNVKSPTVNNLKSPAGHRRPCTPKRVIETADASTSTAFYRPSSLSSRSPMPSDFKSSDGDLLQIQIPVVEMFEHVNPITSSLHQIIELHSVSDTSTGLAFPRTEILVTPPICIS